MATYHLTIHQLLERLSHDDDNAAPAVQYDHHADTTSSSEGVATNKRGGSGMNKRSDSVISWGSESESREAEEIDFTGFFGARRWLKSSPWVETRAGEEKRDGARGHRPPRKLHFQGTQQGKHLVLASADDTGMDGTAETICSKGPPGSLTRSDKAGTGWRFGFGHIENPCFR
ncbi:hypothetical protein M409DRAFT_51252 [Zasmidium cellare ATCC 36951]|uniref:Uncharacterized protein n=1 Tax=Zasmidium cellare ATCC 36951 TaxID=1080233 RepID=A0A6A6CXS3_ZASCE|nr:uncharacterized protein M409DRAFT_51252 [Zasmidium cellare ATCC 36951]KAF2171018.1 hypothetical protein M409DRAFT_51252 [Zasmidium cellare ATCC 36951]